MSGQGRPYSVDDWCQVKEGIFCGGPPQVKVKVGPILWMIGVRSR